MYETMKALHIISLVCWFAGLFYMPRLFVYHIQVFGNSKSNRLFKEMERKLYFYITTPAMVATWLFGLYLIKENPAVVEGGWIHVKLLAVVVLTGFHISLGIFRKRFRDDVNLKTGEFFRYYNEIPTVILIICVFLAVLKPF
jgi:putative membrane protein